MIDQKIYENKLRNQYFNYKVKKALTLLLFKLRNAD